VPARTPSFFTVALPGGKAKQASASLPSLGIVKAHILAGRGHV
jgi:hypothetical protein